MDFIENTIMPYNDYDKYDKYSKYNDPFYYSNIVDFKYLNISNIVDSKLFDMTEFSGIVKSLKVDELDSSAYPFSCYNLTISLDRKAVDEGDTDINYYKNATESVLQHLPKQIDYGLIYTFPSEVNISTPGSSDVSSYEISMVLSYFQIQPFLDNHISQIFSINLLGEAETNSSYLLDHAVSSLLLGMPEKALTAYINYIAYDASMESFGANSNQSKFETFESLLKFLNNNYNSLQDIHDIDNPTALEIAYSNSLNPKKMQSVASLLLKYGLSIDATNYQDITLLPSIVLNGDYEWFQFAKEHGAKLNVLLNGKAMLDICIGKYNDIDNYINSPNVPEQDIAWHENLKQGYILIARELVHENPKSVLELDTNGHTYLDNAHTAHDLSLYNALVSELNHIEHY